MNRGSSRLRRRLGLLLAGLLIAGLTACAPGPSIRDSHGSLPAPGSDMGRIYFYRAGGLFMAAVEAEVVVNSRKVGNLAPGTAFYRDAFPGRYEVVLADNPEEVLDLTVAAGALSFVEISTDVVLSGVRFSAREVAPAEAEAAVLRLTLVAPESAPDE